MFDPDNISHRPPSLRSLQQLLVRLGNGRIRVPQHLPETGSRRTSQCPGPCAMASLVELLVNQRTSTKDSRPTTPWPKSDWTTQFPKAIEKFTKTGKLKERPNTLPKLKGANAAFAVSDSMHAYRDLVTAFVGIASTTPPQREARTTQHTASTRRVCAMDCVPGTPHLHGCRRGLLFRFRRQNPVSSQAFSRSGLLGYSPRRSGLYRIYHTHWTRLLLVNSGGGRHRNVYHRKHSPIWASIHSCITSPEIKEYPGTTFAWVEVPRTKHVAWKRSSVY